MSPVLETPPSYDRNGFGLGRVEIVGEGVKGGRLGSRGGGRNVNAVAASF